jgi:hypothetical protein
VIWKGLGQVFLNAFQRVKTGELPRIHQDVEPESVVQALQREGDVNGIERFVSTLLNNLLAQFDRYIAAFCIDLIDQISI